MLVDDVNNIKLSETQFLPIKRREGVSIGANSTLKIQTPLPYLRDIP